ncbi:DUF485 domain-containing protein [Paraburkholderia strydomiana]|jgi:uncharacterized membrane protein (DUF485 family)|uniref:DUF485 domain-containing protein n=1 Tax=Paraburkholderia strydomiana TaxID=1245417 RepID=A0ABW9EQT3_9BURK
MNDAEIDWDAIYGSERFQQLARRRRNTIVALGALAAVYYFSIPALIAWAPDFFKIRLAPGINLGTLFAVSQYPFGGVIACVFLRRIATLDNAATTLAPEKTLVASQEESHAF